MHLQIYTFIHINIYTSLHVHSYTLVTFIHLYIYTFIHLYIYTFIQLYIYTFIHLYIYTFRPTANHMVTYIASELATFEWWISGLMLDPLFFLISRLNSACSPFIINLKIN